LCYDIKGDQHALTWREGSGFSHNRVDAGEDSIYRYKMTPVLVLDGVFDPATIAERFKRESEAIDETVANFVSEKLMQYPTKANEKAD
jgi:hypothetical protein